MPDLISAFHFCLFAILAGAFGWKAATELDLPNKGQAIGFAMFFAMFGPSILQGLFFGKAGEKGTFGFGDIGLTIGLAVIGIVVAWMMQPARS